MINVLKLIKRRHTMGGRVHSHQHDMGGRVHSHQHDMGDRVHSHQHEIGDRVHSHQHEMGGRVHSHQHDLGGRVHSHQHEMSDRVHSHQHIIDGRVHSHQYSLKIHDISPLDTEVFDQMPSLHRGENGFPQWGYLKMAKDESKDPETILFINDTGLETQYGDENRDIYFDIKSVTITLREGVQVDVSVAHNFDFVPRIPVPPDGYKLLKNQGSVDQKQMLKDARKFEDYVNKKLEKYIKHYEGPGIKKDFESWNKNLGILYQREFIGVTGKHYRPLVSLLQKYKSSFNEAYGDWEKRIEKHGWVNFLEPEKTLTMGLCRSEFTNDHHGKLSPFGPYLEPLSEDLNHYPIGILNCMESLSLQFHYPNKAHMKKELANSKHYDIQSTWESLNRAYLLTLMVNQKFVSFIKKFNKKHKERYVKENYVFPPLIQLIDGFSATWASDKEGPTIITINKKLAKHEDQMIRVAAYAALPHELGHDIMDTFKDNGFLEEMQKNISDSKKIKNKAIWKAWISEIFADAVGIAMMDRAAIFGLMYAMYKSETEWETFLIDAIGEEYDPHPKAYLRVLLAIKFAKRFEKEFKIKTAHFNSLENWQKLWVVRLKNPNGIKMMVDPLHKPPEENEKVKGEMAKLHEQFILHRKDKINPGKELEIKGFEEDMDEIVNIVLGEYEILGNKTVLKLLETLKDDKFEELTASFSKAMHEPENWEVMVDCLKCKS